MKIIPVQPITTSPAVASTRTRGDNKESPDFATVLARTVPSADMPATGLKPVARPAGVAPVTPLADHDLLASAASLLDALESYQEQLADHRVRLRDLAPGLARIEKLAGQLAGLTDELPPEHPIHPIAVQLAVTAYQEVERFNSGVYSSG